MPFSRPRGEPDACDGANGARHLQSRPADSYDLFGNVSVTGFFHRVRAKLPRVSAELSRGLEHGVHLLLGKMSENFFLGSDVRGPTSSRALNGDEVAVAAGIKTLSFIQRGKVAEK